MSLTTPVKEAQLKRKSADTPSQLQEAKRLKGHDEEPTPKSSTKPKNAHGVRQPFSNNSLTKEIGKQMALELTEKPFPNPQNQSQTIANKAWRKQNIFRKRNARTVAKKENGVEPAVEEKGKTEAIEDDGGEKKVKKEKKARVDKRAKKTKDKAEATASPEDNAMEQEEETLNKTPKEEDIQMEKTTMDGKGSKKIKKDIVTKKKEKKEKRRKKLKDEEQAIEHEEIDLIPQGLAAERTVANRGNWASSKPVGGHFITHDPVFSIDEK